MVQMFNVGPSRKTALAQGLLGSLSKGLEEFSTNYNANKSLETAMNNPEYKNGAPSERADLIMRAMQPYGETGAKILQNKMQVEGQRQVEQIQDVMADFQEGKEIPKKRMAMLPPEIQMKMQEVQKKRQIGTNIKQSLLKAGYPEETADLWKQQMEAAPVGGQTDVIKQVNDLLKRSPTGKGQFGETEKPKLTPTIQVPGIEDQSYELNFPDLKSSIGRSSADLVKEETENRKINAPLYAETVDSLNALEEDFRDFQQLQEYNMTPGALPTGGEKWNVNWDTGDLRFAAMATPETQDYVKIIARLLGRAKEYFPGRVTNFDLAQFSKRFPRLANSPEGRELITKQLMTANRIAYLKDETLKAAIDHYGAEGDPTQVRRYANENYRRLKSSLETELKDINVRADEMDKKKESEETSELKVYDASGKLVGTIPREDSGNLPEGYTAK